MPISPATTNPYPVWAVLTVLLMGAVNAQTPSESGDLVQVRAVKTRPFVTLGGTVIPYKQVTLAAQLPGRVNHIAGEEGDEFDEGTLLVQIDEKELLAQQTAAYAALRDADAQLRSAGVMFSREVWSPQSSQASKAPGGMGMPSMFDYFFTTPMQSATGQRRPYVERYTDLYAQRTRIEQAQSALLQAQSQIQQIDAKLRDAKSIAPFDGMIINKFVEEGDTVQPGQPMLAFSDVALLQIEVDIPARLMYRGLRVGDLVDARLDVGNKLVTVRVAQVFPMADPQRHTVKVKFDLPPGSPAAPGMYAEIMAPDPTAPVRDMLIIPRAAVDWRGSLPMVRVAIDEERSELRLVRLGEQRGDDVSVLSGLKPGESVYVRRRESRTN